ncbi:MAG: SMC-Scp complex subunit ScpB [Acidobacteria bacterium]|nr:SMC-Scp complex subunit ScpB [Acidobacteriota bacterium]
MDRRELLATLEALLFATDRPLRPEELQAVLEGESPESIEAALEELQGRYREPDRGLRIHRAAGGFRIATRPEFGERIRALFRQRNRYRLSPAGLEVLALIAYRQPVTAVELQQMRGSCSASLVRNLLERKLIRIAGRKPVIGRPILYATGPNFLTHFGLNTLEDLPRLEEVEEGGEADSRPTGAEGAGTA